MRALVSLAALLTATAAPAETPLSAEAFEAEVTGKTLYYSEAGVEYGAEEYLPGRRVRWSFLDGECLDGAWYPQGEMICFVYEGRPDAQCWTFHLRDGALVARFKTGGSAPDVYETREASGPLMCLGPEVGV